MSIETASKAIENVIVLKADNLDIEAGFRAVMLTLLLFAAMFIVGIFACKAIIFSQLFQDVRIEDMVGVNVIATAVLGSAITWAGLKGRTRTALMLGATGALISGIVAFSVACVVFAA